MDKKFVGSGWQSMYGINIKVKPELLAGLPMNKFGEVSLYVGQLKKPNEKSKATHYVAVSEERKADAPF
jgi:hypothetical protein